MTPKRKLTELGLEPPPNAPAAPGIIVEAG